MTSDNFKKCVERINTKEPSMCWAMFNLDLLNRCIKKNMSVDSLKQICNEVLIAFAIADLDISFLTEFLDTKGYGVTIEATNNDSATFSKTK